MIHLSFVLYDVIFYISSPACSTSSTKLIFFIILILSLSLPHSILSFLSLSLSLSLTHSLSLSLCVCLCPQRHTNDTYMDRRNQLTGNKKVRCSHSHSFLNLSIFLHVASKSLSLSPLETIILILIL